MARILVVDDQLTSLRVLERLAFSLPGPMSVEGFQAPVQALAWADTRAVDLVLVDYKMPELDGVEFTRRFRRRHPDVPLIVVTSFNERDIRYRALDAGATDFLTKPVDRMEFRARARNLLALQEHQQFVRARTKWLERRVAEATQVIRDQEHDTLLRLARAGEYRDEVTGNHVLRQGQYAVLIAHRLGLPADEIEILERASPLHDIGKIGIPDHILLKRQRLTAQEARVMRNHVHIGHDILRGGRSRYLQQGAIIALHHHERFDGTGYPQGLAGERIPLAARIVAVTDVFDALVCARPYKPAWAFDDALRFLERQRGGQFDPACVDGLVAEKERILEIHRTYASKAA